MQEYKHIKTDILVVGGGWAALFAAIKAKEAGANVTIVDKGSAGLSGQSPYGDGFLSFKSEVHDLKKCVDYYCRRGEYINNRDFVELAFSQCEDRFNDLVSWGVEYYKNDDGTPRELPPPPSAAYNLVGLKGPNTVRKYAEKIGVDIVDRVMITDLLTKDDRVVGAVGISAEQADFHVFNAKATIFCTGGSAFKPNGWPVHELTGDGDAMAYRVGAEISGKEFVDAHPASDNNPQYANYKKRFSGPKMPPPDGPGTGPTNAEGEEIENIGTLFINLEFDVHQGKGPISHKGPDGKEHNMVGGTSAGLGLHKAEGIFPKSVNCDTNVSGLFAAGDALSTMLCGALYLPGGSVAGSCTTGTVVAETAINFANTIDDITIDQEQLAKLKETVYAPLERKGGYSPEWVTESLQNLMFPYHILYIKKADRLEATLTMVEYFRDHLVPLMKANDAHQLRHAIETKNMVLNAEMKLRASLARKESRGTHYREDYPNRDDNFLGWITLKEEGGKMVTLQHNVPKEWLPNNFDRMTYEEKYPVRMLNEKI